MATPLNEIVRSSTASYLRDIDPANPPPPATIEEELLDLVNSQIEIENVGRAKKNQLPLLKTLTHDQVSSVLLHLHSICRIAPAGKNTDKDYDLVSMYMPDGPDAGIYVTSEDDLRGWPASTTPA